MTILQKALNVYWICTLQAFIFGHGNSPSPVIVRGGSTPCCRPLDCLPAKAGGAVNGGAYAPFILTVDRLGRLCWFLIFHV